MKAREIRTRWVGIPADRLDELKRQLDRVAMLAVRRVDTRHGCDACDVELCKECVQDRSDIAAVRAFLRGFPR